MMWTTIKKFLRKLIPVSRTYLDEALRKEREETKRQTKKLEAIQKKQQKQWELIWDFRWEQRRSFEKLTDHMDQEWKRRDEWGARAELLRLEAGSRPWWVIKCPAPEDEQKVRWGDYPYALSLKRYLEREGIYVTLDMREDWNCEAEADVVLVLRGCRFYLPDRRNKKCRYLMWNISHPNDVTIAEYELYDAVCVGSTYYAEQLKKELKVPVYPLLQCTDTELFYPEETDGEARRWDYIFVGNSRGVARNSVMWAIEDQLPFRIWGSGWDTILKDHMDLIEAPNIENSELPALYRASRATLNDHWSDMAEKHFINNRIFDALACGLPVISDRCGELEEIFPEAVLYFGNKEEFDQCVERMDKDYEQIRKCVAEQWPMIREKYSFAVRAKELLEIVEKLQDSGGSAA